MKKNKGESCIPVFGAVAIFIVATFSTWMITREYYEDKIMERYLQEEQYILQIDLLEMKYKTVLEEIESDDCTKKLNKIYDILFE